MTDCRICDHKLQDSFTVKEMMFGFRDTFTYRECSHCGCLQIESYPQDMDKYYPSGYYSFSQVRPALVTGYWDRFYLHFKHLAKSLYFQVNPKFPVSWPVRLRLRPDDKVLDIGCGNGARVFSWFNQGLNHVCGIDKYADQEYTYSDNVKVIKGDFYGLDESYDLVMMHHTLEHLPEQAKVFRKVNEILNSGGLFLVRIPLKSWAWSEYGVNWVQLDAPRHFYLHTEKSVEILADNTGFTITDVIYDSWELQFIGSEKYQRDIPLHEKTDDELFSSAEIEAFKEKARRLNEDRMGDQASFILKKTN